MVESINNASEAWGITCFRYEIRMNSIFFLDFFISSQKFFEYSIRCLTGDIQLPPRVQEAMQMQVEAERKKRAAILESEGKREAEINIAEGKRRAKILQSGLYHENNFIFHGRLTQEGTLRSGHL